MQNLLTDARRIGVVIPAHNEAQSIGALVQKVLERVPLVVVVDDGSLDKSGEIARENGAEVIRHKICLGKGAALRTGFSFLLEAGCEAVITMDGDGQHLPEDIDKFLRAWQIHPGTDIFVGTRKIAGTQMPIIRKITNLAMSLLISLIAIQYIPDTQNGFRLIRKNVLASIPTTASHFDMETELLIRASWHGFRIRPVPVMTVYSKEHSKVRPIQDTLRFFKMLFLLFLPR